MRTKEHLKRSLHSCDLTRKNISVIGLSGNGVNVAGLKATILRITAHINTCITAGLYTDGLSSCSGSLSEI
ncbi:uncharacterized [Tachysurus ichikawai]